MATTTTTKTTAPHLEHNESNSTCPRCGTALLKSGNYSATDAQKHIEDLQAQVQMLTVKATAAVDRWADYEDEIQSLRARNVSPSSPPATSQAQLYQNRLSAFLTSRKSIPNLKASPFPSTPNERDLAAALSREQTLRQQAEGKLDQASGELEELSAQLFMQANEMVATERKARAKLEERVAVLESRDVEKRKRLERLENSMARIERVRGLLAPAPR